MCHGALVVGDHGSARAEPMICKGARRQKSESLPGGRAHEHLRRHFAAHQLIVSMFSRTSSIGRGEIPRAAKPGWSGDATVSIRIRST